mmetsp:Transcript_121806/g.370312  ORF Transcript_121806/g.370312 Transcript_121806/m.370312 type:complete len:110 (-) Transcript_121806:1496-1825(-)
MRGKNLVATAQARAHIAASPEAAGARNVRERLTQGAPELHSEAAASSARALLPLSVFVEAEEGVLADNAQTTVARGTSLPAPAALRAKSAACEALARCLCFRAAGSAAA